MLETRFPRPVGDVGNANSHAFPLACAVVRGVTARRAVCARADDALLRPFVAAGRRLVDRGAIGITTSCGFLAPFQRELAAALPVPVAVSSLLQVPWVERLLAPGRRCGVITIDSTALGAAHLLAAGALADTPVAGMPADGELARTIFDDRADLDWCAAGDELVRAGLGLVRRHPEVGAIVLECTNLPPYRRRLAQALGLPVYDVGTLLDWFWSGLAAALPGSGAVDRASDGRRTR